MEKTNSDVFNITTGSRVFKEIALGFTTKGFVSAVRMDGENYEPRAASNYLTGSDGCEGLGVFNAKAEDIFTVGPFVVPVKFLSGLTEDNAATVVPSRIDVVRAALREFISVKTVVEVKVPVWEQPPIDITKLDKPGRTS